MLATEGLRRLGSVEAKMALAQLLRRKDDSGLRASAARALGAMHGPTNADDLGPALLDRDAQVRRAAVEALAALGSTEAIPLLVSHQDDSSAAVRFAIAMALVSLGQPLDLKRAAGVVRTKEGNEFQNAIWLIRRHAGKAALPTLVSCHDFEDVPSGSHYNYTLVWQIEACGGPKLVYHPTSGPERTLSASDAAENRRTLEQLRALLP